MNHQTNKSKLQYGKNLRDIRQELNLTQQELADKLGMQRTEITMIETSIRFPNFKRHKTICEAMDVDLSDFPYFDDDITDLKGQLTDLQAKCDRQEKALGEISDYTLITDYKGLDPVHIWVQDIAKNQGRIVIVCYGCALNAYWGSMGGTLREFFINSSTHYIANIFRNNIRDSYDVENYECCLESDDLHERKIEVNNKMSDSQYSYICKIIDCVKERFKEQLIEKAGK